MLRLSSPIRFALIITIVFAASTLVSAYFAVTTQSSELRQRLFQDTEYLARSLSNTYNQHGIAELKKQIDLQTQYNKDASILLAFWDKSTNSRYGSLPLDKPFSGSAQIQIPELRSQSADEENDGTYYGFGIQVKDGWIISARNGRWVTDTQELLTQSIISGLLCAMFAVAVAAYVLARASARKLGDIDGVLKRVADGDISARCFVQQNSSSELSVVAQRMNVTLDKLETSIGNLQQVSMDIAHDLRRPLTRLRLRLEQTLTSFDEQSPEAKNLYASLSELDNLSATFGAILSLAQIESGAQTVELLPVDIAGLCHDIYQTFEPVIDDSGRALRLSCTSSSVFINANTQLLQQAIINLLENALRYTPTKSVIALNLHQQGHKVHLEVCDNGPGIPDEEHDKVLQRFYRLDHSRNTESTGLGLSLVQAIAQRHYAQLQLRNIHPGLCVELIFDLIHD